MHIIRKIRSSSFFQLTFGSIVSQLIIILISPLTTRIYSPEILGQYTMLISLVSTIGPLLCLKYDSLIISEKENINVNSAIVISVISTIGLSMISLLVYIIYLSSSNKFFSIIQVSILFILLLLTGLTNIAMAMSNKEKKYSLIAQVTVIRSLVQNASLILFGYFSFGTTGMLTSQLLGTTSGFKQLVDKFGIARLYESSKDRVYLKKFFIKHINLVKYSFPAQFINSISYTILNFFIFGLFGSTIFGFYSISFRMLGMPLTIISQNASKIFFKEASDEWNNEKKFNKALLKSSITLFLLAIPMVLILFFFSPYLFEIVFGKGWGISGEYVKILVPMYGVRMIVSSLTPSFLICKKQNMEFFFQNSFLAVSILIYVYSKFQQLSIESFLIGISFFYTIIYLIMYVYIYMISFGKRD